MIFKKILLFAIFATAAGFCFADCGVPGAPDCPAQPLNDCDTPSGIPVWPAIGSDADIQISNTASGIDRVRRNDDNIKIVSKIGADLVVENNINLGSDRYAFSGGANMLHPYQAPAGFNIFANQSDMPLLHQEMLEDDGGAVLAMSRSNRAARAGLGRSGAIRIGPDGRYAGCDGCDGDSGFGDYDADIYDEIGVDASADDELAPSGVQDQVRSWVVASGQTLRAVLQDWSNKEGWDLVWGTAREYPIEASAVFKGRFVDVSSALVRNFSRATPVPYAKFYKGNRVLVVTTMDEGN